MFYVWRMWIAEQCVLSSFYSEIRTFFFPFVTVVNILKVYYVPFKEHLYCDFTDRGINHQCMIWISMKIQSLTNDLCCAILHNKSCWHTYAVNDKDLNHLLNELLNETSEFMLVYLHSSNVQKTLVPLCPEFVFTCDWNNMRSKRCIIFFFKNWRKINMQSAGWRQIILLWGIN